jgi:hypothetical protein
MSAFCSRGFYSSIPGSSDLVLDIMNTATEKAGSRGKNTPRRKVPRCITSKSYSKTKKCEKNQRGKRTRKSKTEKKWGKKKPPWIASK